MSKKKISNKEAEFKIQNFFKNQDGGRSDDLKKIKKLAMSHQIKLGNLRKRFCKSCYSVFDSRNSETRLRKGKKIIKCRNCGNINRFSLTA